jgi:hypothetical protein
LIAAVTALLCAALPGSAEDATNAEAGPAKHGLSFKVDLGSQTSGATNFYGLPKEAFDRLSPEQMVELAKSHEPPGSVIILVTVSMFAMIVACVALGVSQKLKRTRLLHETLRLMIEKGQPIPPELLHSPDGLRRPRNDLRNGLVFVSIGLGLGVVLMEQGREWPIALIPLLIGVALLVTRKLEGKANGQPK